MYVCRVFNNNTHNNWAKINVSHERSLHLANIDSKMAANAMAEKNSCNYSYNKLQNKDEKKLSLVGLFLLFSGGRRGKTHKFGSLAPLVDCAKEHSLYIYCKNNKHYTNLEIWNFNLAS